MSDDNIKKEIGELLTTLGDSFEQESNKRSTYRVPVEYVDKIIDESYGDTFLLTFGIDEDVEFIIREAKNTNDIKVVWFYKNYSFISSNFRKLIEKYDGWSCGGDKEKTIMNSIERFLTNGEHIEFNYAGEYTYHLPVNIFRHHDQIMELYESLYNLYYGHSEKYLEFMNSLK